MKVLVVGDIHGRYQMMNQAFDKFLREKYDKIIFMGDIYDSFDRTDEDMIRCANIMNTMLKAQSEKVVCLVGNHDEAYLRYNPNHYRCAGFRPLLHIKLHPLLVPMRKYYQYAYGIGNHLFTHAGLQYGWLSKHFSTLDECGERMGLDVTDIAHLWVILDGIARTADGSMWHEIGPERGGYDGNFGSPLWCDMDEMLIKGPYPGLHQVCGHTDSNHMYRFRTFQDGKKFKDTSVTYVDVLAHKTQFLTLTIEE